jgi:hypothetical protein
VLAFALTMTGCGGESSPPPSPPSPPKGPKIALSGGTTATEGKAMSFVGSTRVKLATETEGGTLGLELRGVNLNRTPRASFDHPDYVDKTPCVGSPCEWTVAPDAAAKYEFRAFLIDIGSHKASDRSQPVQIAWAPPPRPRDIVLLINGKKLPITALGDETDEYHKIPVAPQQVKALWKTDAGGTGYQVAISHGEATPDQTCSTGTSCIVPKKVPIGAGEEMEWQLELLTAKGKKLVSGFKVCVQGRGRAS